MIASAREITLLKDLVRIKFSPYDEELLSYLRENYPKEYCIWKLEDYSSISSTGLQHTSWYFEQDESIQPFLGQLEDSWGFKIVNE